MPEVHCGHRGGRKVRLPHPVASSSRPCKVGIIIHFPDEETEGQARYVICSTSQSWGGTEHVIETGVHRISYDLRILLTSEAAELFEGIYSSHGFYFFAKKKKKFFFPPKVPHFRKPSH